MDKNKDINQIKKDIEISAMKKVESILLNSSKNTTTTRSDLYTIIQKSEEDFIKQTGREMTYGEMREMFG